MSELQISLIVLGAVVILAIVGFNWWQERRARRKMQDSLPCVDDDPLLRSSEESVQRREPGLGKFGLSTQINMQDEARSEPSLDSIESSEIEEGPDHMTDAVIELQLSDPLTGAQLMAHLDGGLDLGRRSVRLFLQTDDGALSTRVNPEVRYMAVQLAVLLANRHGPITAIEWSQIWGKAQVLAEKLEATVDGPEQNIVLDRAAQIDSTCATLDTQVGLTLLLREQRVLADVVNSATAMGFVPMQGKLAWIGDHGLECFTLSRADGEAFDAGMAGVDRLALLLDVPRSPANAVNFGRMLEVGRELARRVGAEVVDDQGRPLADGADVAIDQQLQALYAQLDAAGLAAGAVRTRRVFSS